MGRQVLIVKRNQDYLSDYYGKSIYNFSPIVGINGTGKSTILDFILRHNSNTKSAIDNVKMVSIYTDDEKSLSIVFPWKLAMRKILKNIIIDKI